MIDIKTYSEKMLQLVSPNYDTASTGADLFHAICGLSTEAGELLESKAYNKLEDRINLIEECGDLIWYLNLGFYSLGYSLKWAISAVLSGHEDFPVIETSQAIDDLVINASKLMDHVKRAFFYGKGVQHIEDNKEDIIVLFGDMLLLTHLALVSVGSSLEEAMDKNYRKLWKKRFKGKGKFSQKAVYNRDLQAERKELED